MKAVVTQWIQDEETAAFLASVQKSVFFSLPVLIIKLTYWKINMHSIFRVQKNDHFSCSQLHCEKLKLILLLNTAMSWKNASASVPGFRVPLL
jgi:hypothetical protein